MGKNSGNFIVKKINQTFKLKTDNRQYTRELADFKHAKKGVRKQIQKFGSFMAGMVMPTVGILIAWGLLAALFLTDYNADGSVKAMKGWVHNEWTAKSFGLLIAPMMKYLIPILIAFIAGKMIYDIRGGMVAAFVIFAAIIGNDWLYQADIMGNNLWLNGQAVTHMGAANQIVASLSIAPLAVYLFKLMESFYIYKIKPGFEMIIKNFGMAFFAIIVSIIYFLSWGFVMYGISFVMVVIINFFTKAHWAFPFTAIFTEPLRAMFLNNALNYGVMVPLGMQDIDLNHKIASWYFMVGGNPGPGFGLLCAIALLRKKQRAAAGGSSVIQLLGGIHEVHYVYVLAEPIMVLATIMGAATSLGIVAIFGGGTSAVISPGSLISIIAMSPGAKYIAINVCAAFGGAIVSFLVAGTIIWLKNKRGLTQKEVVEVSITDSGVSFNEEKKNDSSVTIKQQHSNLTLVPTNFDWQKAKLLMVCCDAGMGSSAMAAGIIRKYVKNNNLDLEVRNCAVKDLQNNEDIIVTLEVFANISRDKNDHAYIYPISKFLGEGIYDQLFQDLSTNLLKKN